MPVEKFWREIFEKHFFSLFDKFFVSKEKFVEKRKKKIFLEICQDNHVAQLNTIQLWFVKYNHATHFTAIIKQTSLCCRWVNFPSQSSWMFKYSNFSAVHILKCSHVQILKCSNPQMITTLPSVLSLLFLSFFSYGNKKQ